MTRRTNSQNSLVFLLIVTSFAFCPQAGTAQQQAPRTGVRPGDIPLELPPFEPAPPEPELVPPREVEPAAPAPDGIRVYIKRIQLEGNTVFSTEELRNAVLRHYENRSLSTRELIELRDALTQKYIAAEYVNSGAVIPDQDLKDETLIVRIVEGTLPLDQIEINGLSILRDRYVRNRVELGVTSPLNVDKLRERMQLLLTDPAIATIDARLGPGVRPGDSHLEVDVVEAPRFQLDAFANNDRSVSVGEYQAILAGTARSVFGFGDPLFVTGSWVEGLVDAFGSYSIPVTADDLRFFVSGQYTDAEVVQEPFDDLDIESEFWSVDVGLEYPFYRTLEQDYAAGLLFSRRHSQTFLLGLPFSFAEGAQEGESDVSVLRLFQSARMRSEREVFAARSTFSIGIDVLEATKNATGPDSRFFSWLGQAQYARLLGAPGHEMILRADLQLAADPLLSIEQYSVGGLFSVRGYRRNELIRDNAWFASVEWRYPIFRVPIPLLSETPEDGIVQIAPFFDAGGGWNVDGDTPAPDAIYSIGAGLRWSVAPRITAAVYYGAQLNNVPAVGDKGLQDYGVYFDVRVGLW